MRIDLSGISSIQRQSWLQHAIGPRPICLASTVDAGGHVNLSPFSFFNLFSTTPPVLIFSPARRVRDNTTKHTWENLHEVPELVVNIVDYDIVQQVSLSSCEYPEGVNEFTKAGFTMLPSELIRPPRVRESKVQMECRVLELKPLGLEGGAGNLVIAEVMIMHVDEGILDAERLMIDQRKLQLVARLGGDWYARIGPDNLFEVPKPNTRLGIGFDALPPSIRESRILTGNQLALLANVDSLPEPEPSFHDRHVREIIQYFSPNPEEMEFELHRYAARLLDEHQVKEAWQVLLSA
jgi:flavin reductase (DIM6/NTAB) family NADH-FMN oxidoreductase RutF